jgi:histone deacetylase 11
MQIATKGSLDAACFALEYGWGINLSGGYHHASLYNGEGFCIYADITLVVKYLNDWFPEKCLKFMIIDLDAHQGNGYAKDLINDHNTFILDAYNPYIYPNDNYAKEGIKCDIHVLSMDDDEKYLNKINSSIVNSIEEFSPSFIIYNAGTDCLDGDPLGRLSISKEGIIKRDEIVFELAIKNKIPIVMLMSGGYQRSNGEIIGQSIENLIVKFELLKRKY